MSRARQGWLLLLLSAVLVSVVWGPPPEPYGLSGFVFDRDGLTQMPVGTAVSVNDTNSTSYVNTTTGNAPQSGYYSVVVNGSINDTIIVRAWNLSHYGRTAVILTGDMDDVNVSLNLTRPGEPDVTVLIPADGQVFQPNDSVSVQANVTILGGSDALSCNATGTFSTPGIIALAPGENATQLLYNLTP